MMATQAHCSLLIAQVVILKVWNLFLTCKSAEKPNVLEIRYRYSKYISAAIQGTTSEKLRAGGVSQLISSCMKQKTYDLPPDNDINPMNRLQIGL
jgi:hypothetical protein